MSVASIDSKAAQDSPKVPDHVLEVVSRKERLSSAFTIACSGFALISDGLQNNIMSLTNVVFGQLFGSVAYNSAWSTQLSNSLTVGTILGQLAIGYICDVKGRKWGIVLSTVLIVIGVILCTAAHGNSFHKFLWMFTIARGITGVGVGGEYPSSSTSAAEAANERMMKQRGPVFILVTNLVLSLGAPIACILYLIVFQAAGGLNANLNTVWRTVFGISAVPPLIVFYFRIKMLNSALYRKGAIQKNVPYGLTLRYYWRSLIGTAGAWFLYDFIVFPNGVFSGVIISSIVKAKGHELIRKTAEYQLLLGMIAIPGCFVGAALVNRLGRRNTMILGFSGYLIFGLIVGCAYDKVIKNVAGFVVLYGLMNSFANAGPGDMLGLTSSESYATAVRGTCYGFSAAVGKTGAVLGTQAFTPIRNNLGPRWTFIIAAICGLAGMLVTVLFIRNDLGGDLAEEDAKFAAFLEANGWSGEMGASESIDDLVTTEKGEKSDY
ncbi:MFS Git1p-related glycerophosphoinositol permease [Mycena alexandri]|uniref:MFS Git1p-related glycerophosphoinositol permease n=1 Tax=Mycena alexandri TaxID=1745969 RepID=A0AAD6TIX2_9AGAR|nr:MFS Git1p-related glycerophosphoinositol permease [Mycena alexandri]